MPEVKSFASLICQAFNDSGGEPKIYGDSDMEMEVSDFIHRFGRKISKNGFISNRDAKKLIRDYTGKEIVRQLVVTNEIAESVLNKLTTRPQRKIV